MESLNKQYIKALCELQEDKFTKDILKPLFESMGYERVDFNGGPFERGRDLIAQRRIPPNKEMFVVYVQSKRVSSIQNTKTAAKLSQLIHQLRQCCTGELIDLTGHKLTPNQVYLACPEQISNRLLDEINSQLQTMPLKILFYDGPQIISDIKIYKPDLLDLLTNFEDKLTLNGDLNLNKELLSALKSKNASQFNEYYCDLSFFVGSLDSNLLLHIDIESKDDNLDVKEESWDLFKRECNEVYEKHNINLIKENTSEIEEKFKIKKINYDSKKNQQTRKLCESLDEKITLHSKLINEGIQALTTSLNDQTTLARQNLSSKELSEREDIVAYLKKISFDDKQEIIKKLNFQEIAIKNPFYSETNKLLSWITERKKLKSQLANKKLRFIEHPCYTVKINSQEIIEKIKFLKKQYIQDIELINENKLKLPELKNFLHETQQTLSLLARLDKDDSFLKNNFLLKMIQTDQDRVSISPHEIFLTGHDFAVYGGAGVGKSTTLKAYATLIASEKNNKNIIYIALNKLVDEFKLLMNKSCEQELLKNNLLIRLILLSKGLSSTPENIERAKKVVSDNSTLILDGLDEVYNTIPNIIIAISQFKINHPKTQLIVSSRDCVSYLNEIDFLGITLLPFTKDQLNRFIRGWLKDSNKAEHLIQSIKNRELFEHIKTPLLATITCSLVEKGVNAPSTENEIYSERLRLLTGEYDLHKNIERQKNTGELLRKCAMKIAYFMHTKGLRSLTKDQMFIGLQLSLSDIYTNELLAECLEELINPCNVIILDHITSKYSFGHFRFQEHLASVELKTNRNIDLSDLVNTDWWRGALGLYSQENDISYLIEDTYRKHGSVRKAEFTLKHMINNSPKQRRNGLLKLLQDYIKSDDMDLTFLNEIQDYVYPHLIDRY
ncbi:hypothetical protein SAMN06296273_2719 [Nitrosomonas ureae]|uniref:AAA+ ATPase domain-containing protein n=1 Tax=Nitrosomonas ureae TaxID=44577 RepID=A0A285C0Z6_9PROT|nr:hypothetical protein [Nitrosomonas ureae]SNX61267.1 hypothetical protein SAMN06296273_2719 [Nitrosomonas ureae]